MSKDGLNSWRPRRHRAAGSDAESLYLGPAFISALIANGVLMSGGRLVSIGILAGLTAVVLWFMASTE